MTDTQKIKKPDLRDIFDESVKDIKGTDQFKEMMNISREVLANWFISYDPYSDLFQFYDENVFRTPNSELFEKKNYNLRFTFKKVDNQPLMVELENAFVMFGEDINEMDKTSIIDRVIKIIVKKDQLMTDTTKLPESVIARFNEWKESGQSYKDPRDFVEGWHKDRLFLFLADELAIAREEEKQLSYNEGVEDARLAVCSVEKNTWEKYVYLRIDKIFELLKKLTNKD